MIRRRILGIPMHRRETRRRFVVCYWLAIAAALAVLWRFPIPPDAAHWSAFVPLLLTLGFAGNLSLLLGGFSHGGAVAFYEGRPMTEIASWAKRNPYRARAVRFFWRWVPADRVERFLRASRPVDEREAQLRDWAFHRAFRLMMWLIYAGAVAYLIVSGAGAALLPRFGFVLLELLLVASLSLPQCCLLWALPDMEADMDLARLGRASADPG